MRRQLNARSALNSSQTELEARVRSLTENLIQKQTVVETLTTEKTSLTLQLDRAQVGTYLSIDAFCLCYLLFSE